MRVSVTHICLMGYMCPQASQIQELVLVAVKGSCSLLLWHVRCLCSSAVTGMYLRFNLAQTVSPKQHVTT